MAVTPSAKARQKHSIGRGSVLVIAAVAGLGGLLWAPSDAEATVLYLTYQVPSRFAGTKFDYGDIVKYDTDTGISSLFFNADDHFGNHGGGGIDALEVFSDGTILLSTNDRAILPGVGRFDRNDIIHYDPLARTGSIVLDGGDHFRNRAGGLTNFENIDVLDLLPDGSFLLSSRDGANWDGLAVDGDDIFRYDPTTGTSSLFFDGDTIRTSRMDMNIDAFDIMMDGRYLLSIFKTRTVEDIGRVTGADLFTYDPTTGQVEMFLDHDDIHDWRGKHRNFTGVDTESPPPPPLIPEPISSTLFGLGLLGVGMQRRSNKRARTTTTCCDKSTLSTS